MKTVERIKAQKAVDRIQSGNFDENDVDNLLMRLRAYSSGHSIFREAADFVAHNDARRQGLTTQSLYAFYLSFKYFVEYVSPKKPLDISQPFPRYIKHLMKCQVDKCKPEELRQRFHVTPERLKARIDTLFKEDAKADTATLRKPKVSYDTFLAVQHLLGFIGSHPAFTAVELINDLIAVLKRNKLTLNEVALRTQQHIVVLCFMLLIHQAKFDYGGVEPGACALSCESPSLPLGVVTGDAAPPPLVSTQFGTLQVSGLVKVKSQKGFVTVAYPVFTSKLQAAQHCDTSLFVVEEPHKEHPRFYVTRIAFDQPLILTADRKLGPAHA